MSLRLWERAEPGIASGSDTAAQGWERAEDSDEDGDLGGEDSDSACSVDGMDNLADDGLDDDEGDDDPSEVFIRGMLDLLLCRTLNARQFCILMYKAGKAGLAETVQYGLPPGRPSGHYNRKVKRKFKVIFRDTRTYRLKIPGRDKNVVGRVSRDFIVAPVWDQLDEDFRRDRGSKLVLEEFIADGNVPPIYDSHPVVLAHQHEAPVYPLSLFVDGVPYSHNDGVIGWWLINHVNKKRYFIGALRKKVVCQCGCKGWCTFYPIFVYIHYILKILADKIRPHSRHDGKPWGQDEVSFEAHAGEELLFRCAMLFFKGNLGRVRDNRGVPSME